MLLSGLLQNVLLLKGLFTCLFVLVTRLQHLFMVINMSQFFSTFY